VNQLSGLRRTAIVPGLVLAATLLASPSATFALDPSLQIGQYAHTSWTLRDGYSLGGVFAMAQTPDGYLWLGGEFGLFRFDSVFGGPVTELATLETGTGYNLGCSSWATELAVPETVDNQYYRYLVQGGNETIDGLTTVGAIRIYYRLQVSPAGFPSFNDVPASDPGFQFIEALVSSGITAGCGNGNYCPDAPLTRRQMAVFLAKALGLHWPDIPGVN